jgi:hypothetical protein
MFKKENLTIINILVLLTVLFLIGLSIVQKHLIKENVLLIVGGIGVLFVDSILKKVSKRMFPLMDSDEQKEFLAQEKKTKHDERFIGIFITVMIIGIIGAILYDHFFL